MRLTLRHFPRVLVQKQELKLSSRRVCSLRRKEIKFVIFRHSPHSPKVKGQDLSRSLDLGHLEY